MVNFPVRKCYHTAKVGLLVILVIAVLALFEQWRGGKRGTKAFMDPEEEEFERQIIEDEARIVPGLGEGGVAAYLTGADKKRGEESEKKLAMNVYLSDRIAYNRTLKDHRNPACDRVVYDAELPSASVILIFHNEPYSVVVRTVWSVINSVRRTNPWFRRANFLDNKGRTMKLGYPGQDPSSPLVYLKEIILVDDNSTLPELKGKLSHYVRTRLPPDLIRILRLPDRVGLTRARLAGARYAVGDVLVFLDSHCEAQPDWLRPQLQAIKEDPHAVLVPIIDVIDASNFYYSVQDPATFQVGGFTFTGHFTWIDVPEREKKRRGSDISPTWSPTMAGGLFAINRAYYWELGAYDEQMAGWGGENLEMSFRIWQCGGTLETVPCSRVGHVFRSFHPYGLPAHTDTHGINTARMAEVWMDEYAELFYLHRPDLRNSPKIGDVTHRKVLREKLQCKPFQWYLDTIYKEKFVPVRDAYGYGRFQNPATGLCLDTLQREAEDAALGVYPCHAALQATQYLILSLSHELRSEDDCAHAVRRRRNSDGAMESDESNAKVLMAACRGTQREKKWTYIPSTQQIQHTESGMCLDAGVAPGADVLLRPCSAAATQRWRIDYSEDNDFHMSNEIEPNEQQIKLRRLRGQKRKSRSLLSYSNSNAYPNTNNTGTIRRHSHKKHRKRSRSKKNKKTKNKFILKLVRELANHSEEHLEVDIHCKHRQLYPNNSFVRDLVTILNEKDIKVINNGRVFERNKVTQLDGRAAEKEAKVLTKLDIVAQQAPPDMFEQQKKMGIVEQQAPPDMSEQQKATSMNKLAQLEALRWPGFNNVDIFQQKIEIVEQQAPPDIFERKKIAKKARKKVKQNLLLQPQPAPAPAPALASAPAPAPAPVSAIGRSEPRAHRIIIEDFVELNPTNTPRSKRMKKRKRKRPTTPAPPPPPPPRASPAGDRSDLVALMSQKMAPIEDQISVPPQSEEHPQGRESSGEEAAMAVSSDAERRASRASAERGSDTDESRARHNATWRRQRRKQAPAGGEGGEDTAPDDLEDEVVAGPRSRVEEELSPVKVVMRSNLTFKLGDEFFQWRRDRGEPGDQNADLSFPSTGRSPPPIHAWLRGSNAFRKDVRNDVRNEARNEVRNDVNNDVRNDVNIDVRNDVNNDVKNKVNNVRNDVDNDIVSKGHGSDEDSSASDSSSSSEK